MTKKSKVQDSERITKRRAEELSEKTLSVQMQKETLEKQDTSTKSKANNRLRADVTDKHHDA